MMKTEPKIDEPDFGHGNVTYFVLGSLFTVFLIVVGVVLYVVLKGFG